jgi:hypothetical protein
MPMRIHSLVLLLLVAAVLVASPTAVAGAEAAAAPSRSSEGPSFAAQVEQWGVQEITLLSSRHYQNPFADVRLRCRFTSAGREVVVDGFYDGHQTWKARLMPDTPGHWTFTTVSNDAGLNGRSGSFDVDKPGAGNHGPVRVRNKYHFAYADGTPFFPLGTTFYDWLQRGPEVELRTLSTLGRSPFNKVRFMVLPFGGFSAQEVLFPYPQTGSGKFDFDRFEPEYFAHYEARLRDLQGLGIQADLILFHPYDRSHGFSSLDTAHAEAYLRYVVARFAAFRNVWWTLTNEFEIYPVQKDWRHLGERVAGADPYGHLLGIHNCCFDYYDNSQPWITHVILQDITLQRRTGGPRNDASLELNAREIGKPVMVDEYGYEGNRATAWGSLSAREVVEMHWSITMAGAYGSHGESYVHIAGGVLVGDSPERLGFLKAVLTQAPYAEMEPASASVHSADPTVTALAKPGAYYLIHFAPPKEVATWNLGSFGPATPARPLPVDPGPIAAFVPGGGPMAEVNLGDGVFQVELIDPWNMKVYLLGYTSGPQQFGSKIALGVVRLVKVDRPEPQAPFGTVAELMKRFEADPN